MTIRPSDPLALVPAAYVAHLYGRSSRTVCEWVFRYRLTRLTSTGAIAKGRSKGYWLSLREVRDRVPASVRERKGQPDPVQI